MDPISSSADLRALQALGMEALNDSIEAQKLMSTSILDQQVEPILPDHLGKVIDLSA